LGLNLHGEWIESAWSGTALDALYISMLLLDKSTGVRTVPEVTVPGVISTLNTSVQMTEQAL